MPMPLRVLMLEDRIDDAELVLDELRRSGFAPDWWRVETSADYLAGLDPALDVILADYRLPQFDALTALHLLQVRDLDIPFIVVTGYIGDEEAAAQCMKEGAADYLLKDRLVRLGPAVAHAIERKRLRDEKRRAEEALRRRAEELADADRRKNEFLALLAHELRNPLGPLNNGLYILRQSRGDPKTADWALDVMDRQLKQMVRLIDDLLDISGIAWGKIELHREIVDLATAMTRAAETSRPLIAERRHELIVSLPETPIRLNADPARLEQILTNLLNNAAKYTDPGGRIWLSANVEGSGAALRVRDTGVGIAPEMIERIFEPFAQAGRSRSSHRQWGLGIGLTLVRSLVKLHDGTVEAHSDGPGKGSEFVVRLPVVPTEKTPHGGKLEVKQLSLRGHALHVLVVDDSADMVKSLARILQSEGHDVRTALDGPTALAAAHEFHPEVVLLDIGMPGMDGYEVARRLRESGDLPAMLVAVTGFGQEEDQRRSKAAGFDLHLVKPVDPGSLNELFTGLAERHHPSTFNVT
jgi:two-component system CheB/CheR fusion protein